MDKKLFGDFGEDMAEEYLIRGGCTILARNFSCRAGELDIVADKDGELVFCEVKTRKSDSYGFPAEAVNYRKRERMKKAAAYFALINSLGGRRMRFDVIEVYLNHYEGAF